MFAVAALVPAAAVPLYVADWTRPRLFGALLALGVVGPAVYVLYELQDAWHGGLATNLWVSVAASAALFAGTCAISREAWRLTPLLFGYLAVLGLIAVFGGVVAATTPAYSLGGWLLVHIVLSVAAYAFATMAAVAGAAVVIKQRALKRKAAGALARLLPPVAEADRLQVVLLAIAAVALGVDILTGMATEYAASGVLIQLEHKTLLSILAFVVIFTLLVLHARAGVRGRHAARVALMGYLLLTLGYPGVKFVTDVLLA